MTRLPILLAALVAMPAAAQTPALDATRAALSRIAETNPRVNAVVALDPQAEARARALDLQRRARGPLHGLPVLLKDNIDVAGLPNTAGSRALAGNVPQADAPLVARLRAAGAVVIGKANLSEWANFRSTASTSGWSGVGGQTRNPHALDRSPCGSSSGSAAAVAAGMVPAAIGTETDGSITCPAAMNGVVGLKPTVGLVSRSGIIPISAAQDTAGPIARDVSTAARLLAAIAGPDPADPATAGQQLADYGALPADALKGARIGVVRFSGQRAPAVVALFERALAVLRARGATLVELAELGADAEAIGQRERIVLDTEFMAGVNAYLATTPATVRTRDLAALVAFNRADDRELALFGQETFERALARGGRLDDPAYRAALAEGRALARGALARLLDGQSLDALVAPTAGPAPPFDAVSGDRFPPGYGLGSIAAVAGWPHLTVPMGGVRGLPVGLSFIGRAWSEARLLALGADFEAAGPPPLKPAFRARAEEEPSLAPLLAPAR